MSSKSLNAVLLVKGVGPLERGLLNKHAKLPALGAWDFGPQLAPTSADREHLLEACADLVTVLLDHCASVRILATSRQPLGVANEEIWPVPSLTINPPGETVIPPADPVRRGAAFVDRARAVWSSFVPSSDLSE